MRIISVVSLILGFGLSTSVTVAADALRSKEDARVLSDAVVRTVASGDVEAGLKLVKPYVIVPESEFDAAVESAKEKWPSVQARFGKSIGYEFVCEQSAGESIYRIVEIVKFEKHAVRFTFLYYRPKNDWLLNTYHFDDQIQSVFCGNS